MNLGCRVQDQLNTSEPTAPYLIGRELYLRKLPGRQWESNPQRSEQLRAMTIKTSASTETGTTAYISYPHVSMSDDIVSVYFISCVPLCTSRYLSPTITDALFECLRLYSPRHYFCFNPCHFLSVEIKGNSYHFRMTTWKNAA